MSKQQAVRTVLSDADQNNLLKFLESRSGRRVMAWVYENGPGSMLPGSQPHDYIVNEGRRSGYNECLYTLRRLPFAPLSEVNVDTEDNDNEDEI